MKNSESGNIIFIILIGIVLIGLVTAALRSSGIDSANIDREELSIRASEIRQHASEMERGVAYVMQNGFSEANISFAQPDAPSDYGTYGTTPTAEVFNPAGGGATWREPPDGVSLNGDSWEFYGSTAIPGAGTDRAELVAVLPRVSPEFCALVNETNGQSGQQPDDPGTCLYAGGARFTGLTPPNVAPSPFATIPNTMDEATFSVTPALEACVQCGSDLHFYHVLLVR